MFNDPPCDLPAQNLGVMPPPGLTPVDTVVSVEDLYGSHEVTIITYCGNILLLLK